MLRDMIHAAAAAPPPPSLPSQEQLSFGRLNDFGGLMQDNQWGPPPRQFAEEISSPISAQMFEFCENELFPETLGNSEVSSCSNYCYEDNSSYTNTLSFSNYSNNNSISSITSNTNAKENSNTNNNIWILYDQQEDSDNTDLSASMNFLSNPTFPMQSTIINQDDQFDISTLQAQSTIRAQMPLTDVMNGLAPYQQDLEVALAGVPLSLGFQDNCLSTLPSYGNLDPSSPSCSLMDPTMGQFLRGSLSSALSTDASEIYSGSLLMDNELQPHELDFQGENVGVFGSDSVQQCYSASDIQQSLSNDNHQLVNGVGSSTLKTDISNLEESAYKVGRLSAEERKARIHRYMKKRNERNFSKEIKYACRKTLADSRSRVRGRFAKNDDFGEPTRANSCNHDDEDDEEVTVKEEDVMVDSSNIFSHISGVNSFKCNYPIQSWI